MQKVVASSFFVQLSTNCFEVVNGDMCISVVCTDFDVAFH